MVQRSGLALSSSTQACWSEAKPRGRQFMRRRRIGDLEELHRGGAACATDVNDRQRGVDWQMTVADARCNLKSMHPKSFSDGTLACPSTCRPKQLDLKQTSLCSTTYDQFMKCKLNFCMQLETTGTRLRISST